MPAEDAEEEICFLEQVFDVSFTESSSIILDCECDLIPGGTQGGGGVERVAGWRKQDSAKELSVVWMGSGNMLGPDFQFVSGEKRDVNQWVVLLDGM